MVHLQGLAEQRGRALLVPTLFKIRGRDSILEGLEGNDLSRSLSPPGAGAKGAAIDSATGTDSMDTEGQGSAGRIMAEKRSGFP